ncbi:MAG: hypothetical protein KAI40_11120 [Desulfobacterales bacterium]|nr:hypothetical protein [Desulfobacterales bacterium]
MEDISRELEKEIESYSSPARTKRKSETRLIAVDDFGKMKSADWIKKLVLFLLVLSVVLSATTILFFKLYANYKVEYIDLRENLNLAEKKIKDSIKEKEYLMAKLVISNFNSDRSVEETKKEDNVNKVIESKVAKIVKKKPKPAPKIVPPEVPKATTTVVPEVTTPEVESEPDDIKNVGIERFTIVKDDLSGDLLIKFRVFNTASEKGDASGRVFVVLSSQDGSEANQLVVPTVSLKDNIPTIPRRGQYFSIAHFKPVNFRIRNIPNPELYTKATVLVFGKENVLILNEEINISIGN